MPSRPSDRVLPVRWADALTALIVGAAFACRLPSMTEPIGIDQGIFLTTGWGMTQGLTLYRDLWDQKPPGIHFTYAAAIALAGPHASLVFWLDFLSAVATCVLIYVILLRTSTPFAARAAAIVYATLMIPAARYGYGGFLERAVPECFITLLAAAAWWLLTPAGGAPGTPRLAAAAALVGVAALYKPTALAYFPAVLVWLHTRSALSWRGVRVAGAALLVPAACVGIWLAATGILTDAWIAVVEYNRAYVALGSGFLVLLNRLAHEGWRLTKTDPLWTLGILGAGVALVDLVRGRAAPAAWLGICWVVAAVLAAGANGIRMYSTYFIPPGAPLALLAGWLFNRIAENPRPRPRIAWAIVTVALASAVAVRSHYPARAWTMISADLASRHASIGERLVYLERFGGYQTGRGYSARANAELAAYLAQHTGPADRIYIFGMAPAVYFLSHRLPANRFIWTYPGVINIVGREDFTSETLATGLARSAVPYIVLERNNRDSLTGWRSEVEFAAAPMRRVLEDYVHEVDIEDFMLYRRRPRSPS